MHSANTETDNNNFGLILLTAIALPCFFAPKGRRKKILCGT
jgi:hypothetical protein